MAEHIWDSIPEKSKEIISTGAFRSKLFRLDASRSMRLQDLEKNAIWLRPCCERWPHRFNSGFFWADVWLMLDAEFASGKLLQKSET